MTRAASHARAGRPLALTMGDPAGIGLDIALIAWKRRHELGIPPFVLFGDAQALADRAARLSFPCPIAPLLSPRDAAPLFADRIPVVAVPCRATVRPGDPDVANAAAVIGAIEQAVAAVAAGDAAAVVTNPISKRVLQQAGFRHPGHTEFLGALAEHHQPGIRSHPVMMLASEQLRVVPLTVHIPLSRVPAAINPKLIFDTLATMASALRTDFNIAQPRIAVTGLNPHAGEGGGMGREEIDIIAPALATARGAGLNVSGPHPADTLFHAAARRGYDAVLAMYHDQALIPLKTLAFDTGVNVTIGLPFVRTSPDHGTAFDIAASGRASATSLIAALRMAAEIARQRAAASV